MDSLLVTEADVRVGQSFTSCYLKLPANNIDTCDLLRHGVFNLNTRIDFNEIKLISIGIDKEFDRAGVFISGSLANSNCRITYLVSHCGRKVWSGSNFYYFLVSTLHGTVSLKKVYKVSMGVSQ